MKENNSFCVAVSVEDGAVIQTTASLTSILGYPEDMWIGRSFTDFMHEKEGKYILHLTKLDFKNQFLKEKSKECVKGEREKTKGKIV